MLNDYASRHPATHRSQEISPSLTEKYVNNVIKDNEATALLEDDIKEATDQDEELQLLKEALRKGRIEDNSSLS